jgi:hypothetical protein
MISCRLIKCTSDDPRLCFTQLHSQISVTLESTRRSQLSIISKIADVFLPFVSRLEIHQPYLVRFEAVTKSIDEMTADSASDFGEFVRMQSSLPECGSLTLSSFLLKPVQRLMKYPLFFRVRTLFSSSWRPSLSDLPRPLIQQLCDLTPPTHPDHVGILSLLRSTDSMIRAMQEVKTREDEYEEAKTLQSRMRGLPAGFQVARRDRRLVAYGLLRRVHISEKDRSILEVDAGRRGGWSGNDSAPVLSLSPRSSKRTSNISDSGSSTRSAYSEDPANLTSPATTPGSATCRRSTFGPDSHRPRPSSLVTSPTFSHLRPLPTASNSSSTYTSEDSSSPLPSPTQLPASAFSTSMPRQRSVKRVIKSKAKESPVHVFVFSDLVVLATNGSDVKLGRTQRNNSRKFDQGGTYKVIERIGLSRVLGVSDLSGKTSVSLLLCISSSIDRG